MKYFLHHLLEYHILLTGAFRQSLNLTILLINIIFAKKMSRRIWKNNTNYFVKDINIAFSENTTLLKENLGEDLWINSSQFKYLRFLSGIDSKENIFFFFLKVGRYFYFKLSIVQKKYELFLLCRNIYIDNFELQGIGFGILIYYF